MGAPGRAGGTTRTSSSAAAGCTGTSPTSGPRSRAPGSRSRSARTSRSPAWFVGEERRSGTIAERDAIAERGWDKFVDGVEEALPQPHDPLFAADRLARFDGQTIADRLDELDLTDEEREVLAAEVESVAHGRLDDAGAVSILRWHALSGGSLALTQFTGGRVTVPTGTRSILEAIASKPGFETRLETPVAAVTQQDGGVEVHTRAGETLGREARRCRRAAERPRRDRVRPAALRDEAGRDRARAGLPRDQDLHPRARRARRSRTRSSQGHPFAYLDTEILYPDGTQILIGFGPDAENCDATDLAAVQRQLDEILPGYEVIAATGARLARGRVLARDVGDPPSRLVHDVPRRDAEARGSVILAGSDFANGWAGFMDGAIESGLRAGAQALRGLRS